MTHPENPGRCYVYNVTMNTTIRPITKPIYFSVKREYSELCEWDPLKGVELIRLELMDLAPDPKLKVALRVDATMGAVHMDYLTYYKDTYWMKIRKSFYDNSYLVRVRDVVSRTAPDCIFRHTINQIDKRVVQFLYFGRKFWSRSIELNCHYRIMYHDDEFEKYLKKDKEFTPEIQL